MREEDRGRSELLVELGKVRRRLATLEQGAGPELGPTLDGAIALALTNAPIAAVVASTNKNGAIFFVNHEFVALTGYGHDRVPTVDTWLALAYPDPAYRAAVLANWERDVNEPNRNEVYSVCCADGQSRQMLLRVALLPGERMIVTMLDVSHQEETLVALRQSEERFRQLAANLPIGIAVHTRGIIAWVNAEAVRLIGADGPESQIGRGVFEFVHPDFAEVTQRRIAGVYSKERSAEWMESRFVRTDGTPVDVEVTSSIVDWRGAPAGLVLFADISSRKQVEAERQALLSRVQEAQRMESLADLAGGVAHDFNNLLVGIIANADLAQLRLGKRSAVRKNIEGIQLAAGRAAELARAMLAYSGRGRFVVDEIDVSATVTESIKLAESAIAHRVRIRLELAVGLPTILADRVQMGQVVMNLVTNAAESIGEGEGKIAVRTGVAHVTEADLADTWSECAEVPGDFVWLEVEDQGPGMDDDTRRRVFDPFFTTKFTGRGLGLAGVHGIVKGHRGIVTIRSQPGQGACFRVLLPLRRQDGAEVTQAAAPQPPPAPLGTGHILVVDDEKAVRLVAQECLQEVGFSVSLAAGGREAVAMFSADPTGYAAVLLDLSMPRMDGRQTLAALRAVRNDIPVVLTSGHNRAEAFTRLGDDRPAGFVQKPYRVADLVAVMSRAVAAEQ